MGQRKSLQTNRKSSRLARVLLSTLILSFVLAVDSSGHGILDKLGDFYKKVTNSTSTSGDSIKLNNQTESLSRRDQLNYPTENNNNQNWNPNQNLANQQQAFGPPNPNGYPQDAWNANNGQLSGFLNQPNANYGQEEREPDDLRVPFWNIAHMINSIEQIQPVLRNGSNGIETDVSFNKLGVPVESYHGFPCDCGRHCHYREDFIKFVDYVASITLPPAQSNLQLILFDLKLTELKAELKVVAGEKLATILHEHLFGRYTQLPARQLQDPFTRPPIRVILSINYVHDDVLIKSFLETVRRNSYGPIMNKFVGFDVGMNDKLANISSMWDQMNGATHNVWQGDGLTNCANLARGIERLKEAISIRNSQGNFRKIYYWTVDILYQIRAVLRLGIDAVLTNQPQRVVQVLDEPEFSSKYRLATHYDDPFSQFSIQASAWKMPLPSIEEAKETLHNIRKTGENFIKTLPDGISAAIKKVTSSVLSSSNSNNSTQSSMTMVSTADYSSINGETFNSAWRSSSSTERNSSTPFMQP